MKRSSLFFIFFLAMSPEQRGDPQLPVYQPWLQWVSYYHSSFTYVILVIQLNDFTMVFRPPDETHLKPNLIWNGWIRIERDFALGMLCFALTRQFLKKRCESHSLMHHHQPHIGTDLLQVHNRFSFEIQANRFLKDKPFYTKPIHNFDIHQYLPIQSNKATTPRFIKTLLCQC